MAQVKFSVSAVTTVISTVSVPSNLRVSLVTASKIQVDQLTATQITANLSVTNRIITAWGL